MAIYTKLSNAKLKSIAGSFGLKQNFTAQGIALGTVNTFYQLSWPEAASVFLKIDEVGHLQHLQQEVKIIGEFQKAGHNSNIQVPIPLQTREGKTWIEFEGKRCLALPAMPGKIVWPADLKSCHMKELGRALKSIHSYVLSRKIRSHRFNENELLKIWSKIQSSVLEMDLELFHFLDKLIDKTFAQKSNQTPKDSLIHGDLFAENLFWEQKKLVGIIDFDAAGMGDPDFDLLVAVHALCYTATQKPRQNLIRALLQAYQNASSLSLKRRSELNRMFTVTALRFTLTRLRDFEIQKKNGPVEPFKDYRDFIIRLKSAPLF